MLLVVLMVAGPFKPHDEASGNTPHAASTAPTRIELIGPSQIPLPSTVPEALRAPMDDGDDQELRLDYPVAHGGPTESLAHDIAAAQSDDSPAAVQNEPTIDLDAIGTFDDLSDEKKRQLIDCAALDTLACDEELAGFGLALILRGHAAVMASISEDPTMLVGPGAVVCLQSSNKSALALRLVGTDSQTLVASWPSRLVEDALCCCPWVMDDLKTNAARLQAIAGALIGPLSDGLTQQEKAHLISLVDVRELAPGEPLLELDETVGSLFIVGCGSLHPSASPNRSEFGPGCAVFPDETFGELAAPYSVVAGPDGASLVVARPSIFTDLPSLQRVLLRL